MADNSRPKRGRPRRTEGTKHITFKNSTYELWKSRKASMGMGGLDNSRFAEVLLHRVGLEDVNNERPPTATRRAAKRVRLWSTPAKENSEEENEPELMAIPCSPIVEGEDIEDADITEGNEDMELVSGLNSFTLPEQLRDMNPLYDSISGDPFEEQGNSSETESSSEDESSHSITDSESDSDGEYRSEVEEEELNDFLEDTEIDISATLSALELDGDNYDDDESSEVEIRQHQPVHASEMQAEMAIEGELEEASGEQVGGEGEGHIEVVDGIQQSDSQIGCQTFEECCEELRKKLKAELEKLNTINKELESHVKSLERQRVIVEIPKLIELLSGKCPTEGCTFRRNVTYIAAAGAVISLTFACPGGHSGIWHSSSTLGQKKGQNIYALSTLLSAGTLITGNNFEKVELLFRFCNIGFISSSTFNRVQSLHVVPAVQSYWAKTKESLQRMNGEDTMVLCGDGRMDSPGFCAKYCAYVIMEHHIGTILDLEIVDKRESGGCSTNMERLGLKRLLERLICKLRIGELTTDASATIIKLVRDLKAIYPDKMEQLFHSLDIWHKSCKLTTKLSAAAKIKGNQLIADWVQPIRNHFWHCAEVANGDHNQIKDKWLGVIHHICGEHEWAEGACVHGPLTELEQQKTYLEKGSKAFKAVQEIVFDRQWLESLKFYVFFRHTSLLESFNAMVLKYAPKRNAFSYEVFVARMELAALDHNFHLLRSVIPGRYKRVYSKRSSNWRVVPVKEAKTYPYWKVLCADIMKRRIEDQGPVTRHIDVAEHNPANIAPNIAMRQPPSTSELVNAKLSRFQK